jgi:hypothetical protein
MKEEPEYDFKILKDQPLDGKEIDNFGHGEIANSIIQVIKKAPSPFNVGIYGQWGVGKSTICKIIEDRLSSEEDYKVVYFDTWKYERDSFRRQFLITLDESLRLNLDFKKRLNQSLTEVDPTAGEIKFDYDMFLNVVGRACLVIFGLGVVGLLIAIYADVDIGFKFLAFATSGLSALTYILNLQISVIKRVQISTTTNKTDSAEGFEEHFAEVISKIQANKLLVIIDNLDRLSSEKAVALLSDIKTFLSDDKYVFHKNEIENNTIFVVPCDNKAINSQLIEEYGTSFDSEEYLRKFFNHSIQIPKFLSTELDNFIVGKLNSTKVLEFKDNYDLVFILSSAFRNNPREIIQFINSLISLYVLVKERKIDTISDSENFAFLAKILVIRSKWSRLYDKIENEAIRTNNKLSEIVSSLEGCEDKDSLTNFLNMTSHVNDDEHLDIYFSLRQSEEQKKVPEWNSFLLSLLEGRAEDVQKIYTSIKANGKLEELSNLLSDYCRRNKKNQSAQLNIFLNIHKQITSDDFKILQNFLLQVFKNIDTHTFADSLNNLDFSGLFERGLVEVSSSNRKEFSQKLFSIITSVVGTIPLDRERIKYIRNVFKIIASNENTSNFSNKAKFVSEAKISFIRNINSNQIFPDSEKNDSFRKDVLSEILEILIDCGSGTLDQTMSTISLVDQFLQRTPIFELDSARLMILEKALKLIDSIKILPSIAQNQIDILSNFTSRIHNCFNGNKSKEEKEICVKIFKNIDLEFNTNKEPSSCIRQYIVDISNSPDSIISTLSRDFLVSNPNGRKSLIKRTRTTTDLLQKLDIKSELTDEEKVDIINHLISNKPQLLSFLDYIEFDVPLEPAVDTNFLKSLIQRMIDTIDGCEPDILKTWIESIKRIGVSPELTDSFVQKMRQARNGSGEKKEVISNFVTAYSKDFGEMVVNEFKS